MATATKSPVPRLISSVVAAIIAAWNVPVLAAEAGECELPPATYPDLPMHAESGAGFAVPGWTLEIEEHGDLDGNGVDDLVFVLRETDSSKLVQESDSCGGEFDSNPRILGAALAEGGRFRRVLADHTLIPRRDSPHLDDPLDGVAASGVSIKRGTLQVSFGHFASLGSGSMGQTRYTFRWQARRFVLIGYDTRSVHRASGEVDELSINYLTRRVKRTQGCIQHHREAVEWTTVPKQALLMIERVGDGMAFHPEIPDQPGAGGKQERPLCEDEEEDPDAPAENPDETTPPHPQSPIGKNRWNWADATSDSRYEQEYAVTRAICTRLRNLEPPPGDWPDAATATTLEGCDSGDLYYGIGMPADLVRARQCALLEAANENERGWFNGKVMLMTLYANGTGATRDLDLATSLACRVDGAPREVHGRILHLQKRKDQGGVGQNFDFCDDITSGMAQGQCAARDAAITQAERSRRLSHLMATWTKAEQRAFAPLQATAKAYANASSGNEVDISGTAGVAFVIEEAQRLEDEFAKLLTTLESEGLPAPADAATRFRAADAELNDVYGQLMQHPTGPDGRLDLGTVTRDGVRETQRTWLRYRDAWTAFAAVKYPQGDPDELRARLTRQRIEVLKKLVPWSADRTQE